MMQGNLAPCFHTTVSAKNVPTVFLEVEMGWDYRGDDEEELVADEDFLPIGEEEL